MPFPAAPEPAAVLVVGSVAFDTVETPFGQVDKALGGAATFFSIAASFFTPIRLVAVVGEDFPQAHHDLFAKHEIDTTGLTVVPGGKTFHWAGKYSFDLNTRETLATELNVFESFDPALPEVYTQSPLVFLANIDPALQLKVLDQVREPRLVAADTMNFWIEGKLDTLTALLRRIDILVINDEEARELSHEWNIVKAAQAIQALGPATVIIKRGEYGALLFHGDQVFSAPGYPLEEVFDPTGAGDTFAGGFMGFLGRGGAADGFPQERIRQAVIMGSVMASFCVEGFSVDRLTAVTPQDIRERYGLFEGLTTFRPLPA